MLLGSHFDELPQEISILRGDLSILGPRPEQPRYVRSSAGRYGYAECATSSALASPGGPR